MANDAGTAWSQVAKSFIGSMTSDRPELLLTHWSRKPRGHDIAGQEVIAFGAIKNVGQGAALHVILKSHQQTAGRTTAALATTNLEVIKPNESITVAGNIIVWWKNVTPDHNGFKYLTILVTAVCWDSGGRRHETTYRLLAVEVGLDVAYTVAPGVVLVSRTTTIRPVWLMKLSSRLRWVGVLCSRFGVFTGHEAHMNTACRKGNAADRGRDRAASNPPSSQHSDVDPAKTSGGWKKEVVR